MVLTRSQKRRHLTYNREFNPADIGYVHLKNVFNIPLDELKHLTTVPVRPIFNNIGRNDKKRVEGKVADTDIPDTTAQLRELVREIYPNLKTSDIVAITSLPGCLSQRPHTDFDTLTINRLCDADVPRVCVVALQNRTKLDVWKHSHQLSTVDPQQRITINMSAGDALFFRGDLVHAGSAYDVRNTRLHVFIDNSMIPRLHNSTWYV